MNKDNVDGDPAGDASPKRESQAPKGRNFRAAPLRREKKYGGRELMRMDETVRVARLVLMDLCRLLKQEGWIDILEDLEDDK